MADLKPGTLPIQSYTLKELAKRYGCNARTFKRWLQGIPELGPRKGNFYSPRQVQIMVEKLGDPGPVRGS